MIFVTQTNSGTKVKRDCQEQILGVRSYLSRDLFLPLFRVCHVNVVYRCLKFLVLLNNLFLSKRV